MPSIVVKKTDATFERVDLKTPNGGDYSIAYFLNAQGEPVAKSQATRIEIQEFTGDGEMIQRTYLEKS